MLFLALLACSSPAPHDWPCWRGAEHDGVSAEADFAVEGRELWRGEVGVGYAVSVVVDGRLYTAGHDLAAEQDVFRCLDARTGERIWSHAISASLRNNLHEGGVLNTPSVADGVVYFTQRDGRAFCFDAAQGELVWERNYAEELGIEVPMHGFSSSPLVDGEQLVLCFGEHVLGVDPADGAVRWRNEPRTVGGHSNPMPFEFEGRPLLAVFFMTGLGVLDRTDGTQLAFHEFGSSNGLNAATPIVLGDRIFISAAYGLGSRMLRFDGSELELLWASRRMRNKVQTCVAWDGHLYGFDEGMLKCLSIEDGEERWRQRGLGSGSLSLAGGRLLVTSARGELLVLEATPESYRELSRSPVFEGGVCWTAPTIVDGRIYVRNSTGQLVCRDHRPGAALADAELPEEELPPAGVVAPAQRLIERHVALVGGREAWAELEALEMRGRTWSAGNGLTGASTRLMLERSGNYRFTIEQHPFGSRERGITLRPGDDGKLERIAWDNDAFQGANVYEGDDALVLESEVRALYPLDVESEYTELATHGLVEFHGDLAWRVDAVTREGFERRLYFGRLGFLVGQEAEHEPLVIYDDYREFGDLRIACERRQLAPDTGEEERFLVESVHFEPFAADAFALPDPVLRLLLSPEEIEQLNRRIEAEYGELFGAYESNFGGQRVEVRAHEGQLALFFDASAIPLHEPWEGEQVWRLKGMETMHVRFVRDEDEAVVALVYHTEEADYEWPRLDE